MTLTSPTRPDGTPAVDLQRLVRPELRFKSAHNEWATPDATWQPLNQEFRFTLDVCATPLPQHAKMPANPRIAFVARQLQ
jgi:hypothetical protein